MFITFEGTEGCGKSTQSLMLYEYLISKGAKVILTREVGGTKLAESVREIMLKHDISSTTELMLVMAARSDHINKVILPKLDEGYVIICDRFIDSTLAYQGCNSEVHLSFEVIYAMHQNLFNNLLPDVTLFLDIQPAAGLKRTIGRYGNNKFERRDIAFHNRVHTAFMEIAHIFKDRIVTIDVNNLSQELLHKKICDIIDKKSFFKSRKT